MVEPPAAADFCDELFMLDFTDDSAGTRKGMRNPNPSRRRPAHFLQEILDAAVDGLPVFSAEEGSRGGGDDDDEEEELEWLANKDAFPALETSFDLSTQALSSGGGGGGGGGAASAFSGERPSPISVLASALLFRAPGKSRSKGLRRRRVALTTFVSPPPDTPSAVAAEGGKVEKRKCRHCESSETPQWRAGPEGPKTLCNACGVRYKSGRLVPEYRPANSPTFSAAIHSNSHRRVVEMRRQKYGGGGGYGRGRRSSRRPLPPPLVDVLAVL